MRPASGVILYPKPAGITSHDCVARVRRTLPRKTKVGHAGTLDPFATGLLLVLVGRMTRAQRWLLPLPKTYVAIAKLGWRSDTGDRDGVLEQTGRVPADPQIATGELMQRPPAYSAVRVDGERLYEKARRGEAVEGEPRPVTVYRAERLWHEGDRAAFEIECSSGTYVRQLVADLGDAYCDELERIGDRRLQARRRRPGADRRAQRRARVHARAATRRGRGESGRQRHSRRRARSRRGDGRCA